MSRLARRTSAAAATALLAAFVSPAAAETIYDFKGPPGDGANPSAGLVLDKEGALYGATPAGSSDSEIGYGTVYKLTPPASGQSKWTQTLLYSFKGGDSKDGAEPIARLILDDQGALYGTTQSGGLGGAGTVFRLSPPAAGQTEWTEAVLYRFRGADGFGPTAGLVADKEGALYGATLGGGFSGHGTVFKLTPPAPGETGWTQTVLYRFKGGADGANPYAGLIRDKAGVLYGTTLRGGVPGQIGFGAVFKLTPPAPGKKTWTESVIHRFTGPPGDGDAPQAGLVAGRDGALYGTTFLGGGAGNKGAGFGIVFKLTPPVQGQTLWTETVLYRFCAEPRCGDGSIPEADLILDDDGALYGTTLFGGVACPAHPDAGCGTVFRLAPPAPGETAWRATALYRLAGAPDGATPLAALVVDRQGALYTTATYGGRYGEIGIGYGAVFKVTPCPAPGSGDRRESDPDHAAVCPAFLTMQ